MKAAWIEEFGAARDVLTVGEMDAPSAGPGEVLVRVHASGINPLDVKKRAGQRGPMIGERMIPHYDGAGIIEAVGEGVDPGRVGARVWLFEGHQRRAFGTAAQYITLPETRACPLPEEVSFAQGACLGIPALTAHAAVFKDGMVDGQTVMVTGAAGAVGGFAAQFARNGGAKVIGTVGSPEKAGLARSYGCAETINYREEDVAERVKELTGGKGVDRIVEVELGGNMAVSEKVLKTGGVIAAYASMAEPVAPLGFYRMLAKAPTIHIIGCFTMPEAFKGRCVADISRWMAEGKVAIQVAQEFPLDDIAAAHETVEDGRQIGGVVVTIA